MLKRTVELFHPEAGFWIDLAGNGILGLDRLDEIVSQRTATVTNIL